MGKNTTSKTLENTRIMIIVNPIRIASKQDNTKKKLKLLITFS